MKIKPNRKGRDWFAEGVDAIDHLNQEQLVALSKYLVAKTSGVRLYSETEIEHILSNAEALYRQRNPTGVATLGGG